MNTLSPPLPVAVPVPASVPILAAPSTQKIVINGEVTLPVITTLEQFVEWWKSDECPERGRFAFLAGTFWVDLTMEQGYTHNDVKSEIVSVLRSIVRRNNTGRTFTDGMLLTIPPDDFSTVPDGMFVLFTTIQAGRVTMVPNQDDVGLVEVVGSPDMVLEVVSVSSVAKDTVRLPELYHAAGIPEFWRVDAREELRFEILRRETSGYVPTQQPDGWWRSDVFGADFLLIGEADLLGQPQFTLQHRP